MKTVFLNGVMLERCSLFVNKLARRFKVASPGFSSSDPALNLIDSQAVAGPPSSEQITAIAGRMVDLSRELAASLAHDLTSVMPQLGPDWQVPNALIQAEILPRVKKILGQELMFRNFVERHPVDLVLSGSDYGSHSRVAALAAREMGIPTLNIEHGFFLTRFRWKGVKPVGVLPMVFTSEFANLDNALEVDAFQEEAARLPHLDTKFLALGTPVQTVASEKLEKAQALKVLGLKGDKKRVLVLGSWIEARAVHSLVQGQLDTLEIYEDLMGSWAESGLAEDLELLIKVHPMDAHPASFPGVKAALIRMAQDHGLRSVHVFSDRLPELLTACDTLLSIGFSSVLFDAFQLEIPSIVMVPRFLQPKEMDGWETKICAVLEEKAVIVADDGAMACAEIKASFDPGRRAEFTAAVARLKARYNLDFRGVEEKSDAIIDWIEELLST